MTQTLIYATTFLIAAATTRIFNEEQLEYDRTISTIATTTTIITIIAHLYTNPFLALALTTTFFLPKSFNGPVLGFITPFFSTALAIPFLTTQSPTFTGTPSYTAYTASFASMTTALFLI